jgi:hypothetical protein
MKKKLLVLSLLVSLFSLGTNAQSNADDEDELDKLKVFLGPEASIPVGSFKNFYKVSPMGALQFEYSLSSKLRIVGAFAGGGYSGKERPDPIYSYNVKSPTFTIIQTKYGPKYFPVKNLFVSAVVGVSYISSADDKKFSLTYAPSIGYELLNSEGLGAMFFASYETVNFSTGLDSKFSTFNIGLRYSIF